MRRFITRINGTQDQELKRKQDEVSDAACPNGWNDMAIFVYNNTDESRLSQAARFDGIVAGITQGDVVVLQLPTGNGRAWEQRLIGHIKAYGGIVAIYLHQPAYHSANGADTIRDTVFTCNYQKALIADSFDSIRLLRDNGLGDHVPCLVREHGKEESFAPLPESFYINKVLDLAYEIALTGNPGLYRLTDCEHFRKAAGGFVYYTARESFQGAHAVSYHYIGDVDGIYIQADGRTVWETNNVMHHYAHIPMEETGESYTIHAYVYTLKGRMTVASTERFSLSEPAVCSENPKISTIIPVYNAEKFIARTIDTILAQSQSDIEIILVDDESTDNTRPIIAWYADRYACVRLLTQKNAGQACARNTGIDYAHGEFIAFMDHDDLLPADAYKALYDAVISTGADVSIGRADSIRDVGYSICVRYNYTPNTLIPIDTYLSHNGPVVIWNKLYRADLCKANKFGPRYFEDNAWSPVVLSYAESVVYTDELVYEWDQLRETQSSGYRKSLSQEEKDKRCLDVLVFVMKHCNPSRADMIKRCVLWGMPDTLSHELHKRVEAASTDEIDAIYAQFTAQSHS